MAADDEDNEHQKPVPTNAEDAKTYKAMESLDAADDSSTTNTTADSEALKKGLADLSGPAKPAEKKEKLGKVNAEDMALIVSVHPREKRTMSEMEVSKVKATDLLRAHGGSVMDTLKAMVTAS